MSIRTRHMLVALLLPAALLALAGPAVAQPSGEDLIRNLKWRSIGPANMSGRISDFEALDHDFTKVIVASASGGVFKSVNAGTTWEPIFDKYGSASIGDVGWFQKNPDIIWVGTGEECARNSIAWGDGIYKSTDGGKTFTHMGLRETHSIGRVITHPTNPDVVWVAAAGHTWGYTGERGLFQTTDGGKTWKKLTNGLPDDGKTGAIDLVMDPKNPNVLYVSFWQRLRQPWRFDSGGPNGGIYKSTDGGRSWKKLTAGLPAGDLGRIGLAISRTKPNVVMAVVEHGFQPQADHPRAGRNGPGEPRLQGHDEARHGDLPVRGRRPELDVREPDEQPAVLLQPHLHQPGRRPAGVPADDGRERTRTTPARTWRTIPGLHPDYHAMWLDPTNKDRYYVGQDAGGALTHDHGKTYIYFDNMTLSQFYAVSADNRDPYYVYGGLQDNGTWGGPSMHREGSILTDFWYNIGGGDGFHTQNDPSDWRTVYGESQGGSAPVVPTSRRVSRARSSRGARTSSTTRTSIPTSPGRRRPLKAARADGAARHRNRRSPRRAGPAGGAGRHRGRRFDRPSGSTGARRFSSRRTTRAPSTSGGTISSARPIVATTG